MNYRNLSKEDFDAIVTGELTHYSIWMENVLIDLISTQFSQPARRVDFERLLLRRDGLTFQDKIEIVRAMLPQFSNKLAAQKLKPLLTKIEEFKAYRNAFAHGTDVTPSNNQDGGIYIEIIARSGKEKLVLVTPESHEITMSEAEALLKELHMLRDELCA
ncbi:hypothetical protein HAP94_17995 [Acidithiobacillus ferrivorans]|nr:hypothetical protein [Acidithiobacillus ferrivorans]